MGAVVAIMAAKKQKELIEQFARAGATSPAGAKSLGELGVDTDDRLVRRLMTNGVIRDAGAGRHYFDMQVFQVRRQRALQILLLLNIVVFFAIVFFVVILRR